MNGSFIGVSYARTVCENSNYLFLVFRCWSRFSSFILYRLLKLTSYTQVNICLQTLLRLQPFHMKKPNFDLVPPTREVTVSLLFQMFSIRKWLRPESKEKSSMLGNIVSHLNMDSRCLSWWRKTGAGWVLKISKGKVTTSSINKISCWRRESQSCSKKMSVCWLRVK